MTSPHTERSLRRAPWWSHSASAAVLFSVGAALLLLPDYFLYPGTDYGAYFNAGRLILGGEILYEDIWSHKGPIFPFYLAGWQWAFGSGRWSSVLALAPVYAALALSVYALVRAVTTAPMLALAAGAASLPLVLGRFIDGPRNGSILVAATALEVAAVACLLVAFRSSATGRPQRHIAGAFAAAGFLAALAPFVRQSSWVAPPLFALAFAWSWARGPRHDSRVWLAFPMAGLFAVAAVGLALHSHGVDPGTFWDQVVGFNLGYAAAHMPASAPYLAWLREDAVLWTFAALGAAALVHRATLAAPKTRPVAAGLIGACGLAVVLVLMSRNTSAYYRIQFLPYLLVLATAGAGELAAASLRFCRGAGRQYRLAVAVIWSVIALFLVVLEIEEQRPLLRTAYRNAAVFDLDSRSDQRVARAIARQAPGEPVWVWGNRGWIYTYSDTRSPNRYYYNAFGGYGYLDDATFESVIARLERSAPPVVVVWPNSGHPKWPKHRIQRVDAFVERDYVPVQRFALADATYPYHYRQDAVLYLHRQFLTGRAPSARMAFDPGISALVRDPGLEAGGAGPARAELKARASRPLPDRDPRPGARGLPRGPRE